MTLYNFEVDPIHILNMFSTRCEYQLQWYQRWFHRCDEFIEVHIPNGCFIICLNILGNVYKAALSIVLLIMPSIAQEQCRSVAFQKPRTRYRCITGNYTTITQVPQHLCTHVCMQKNCNILNYNLRQSYCRMGFWRLPEGDSRSCVHCSSHIISPCMLISHSESLHSMSSRCRSSGR